MRNVIKTEFYLTIRNKMWWMLSIAVACFTIFFTVMLYYSSDGAINSAGDINIQNIGQEVVSRDLSFIDYLQEIICSDVMVMFVTVFTILLSLQEYTHGYLKNIWMNIGKKSNYYLTKILVIFSYVLYLFLIVVITLFLLDAILLKTSDVGDVKAFFGVCLAQCFYEVVFGIIAMTFALCMKKMVPSLICGIVYIAFANQVMCGIINLIVNKNINLSTEFRIEQYLVYGNIMLTKTGIEVDAMIRAICVAGLWAIVALVVCSWKINKRDIL